MEISRNAKQNQTKQNKTRQNIWPSNRIAERQRANAVQNKKPVAGRVPANNTKQVFLPKKSKVTVATAAHGSVPKVIASCLVKKQTKKTKKKVVTSGGCLPTSTRTFLSFFFSSEIFLKFSFSFSPFPFRPIPSISGRLIKKRK